MEFFMSRLVVGAGANFVKRDEEDVTLDILPLEGIDIVFDLAGS